MKTKSKPNTNSEEFQLSEDNNPNIVWKFLIFASNALSFVSKFAKRILLILLYIIIASIAFAYLSEKDLLDAVLGPIIGVLFIFGLLATADPTNLFFQGKLKIIFGIIVALVIGCVTGKFIGTIWGIVFGSTSLIAFYLIKRDFE
jgi:hypothetical protein